ncbi:MAG: ADP-forming succinate--CoA ligase subunit beta, partial [Planifilum fimeticola]
ELLGKVLVTHQTGPEGKEVKRLLIEEGCKIQKEYYVGMVIDRSTGRVTLMASEEGGTEIEEVAARTPEKIIKESIDPAVGLLPFQARRVAFKINIPRDRINKAAKFMTGLYRAFVEKDCSLAEINPLVTTEDGRVMALDAKLNFDSNALYRHPDIRELRDLDEEDPREVEASKYDLSYIALDGNIGCMVNGAGLAMATMDIIKHYGGEPANFLDVGGGATAEKVTEAFKIILSDENVKGILVNIFGGIMKCDVIATGVVEAAKQVGLDRPLVVRLEGTNVELGKKILEESGLKIIAADSMADAAQKIVSLVK